jgi:hypothetical protein
MSVGKGFGIGRKIDKRKDPTYIQKSLKDKLFGVKK